jgi:hypothetical protein
MTPPGHQMGPDIGGSDIGKSSPEHPRKPLVPTSASQEKDQCPMRPRFHSCLKRHVRRHITQAPQSPWSRGRRGLVLSSGRQWALKGCLVKKEDLLTFQDPLIVCSSCNGASFCIIDITLAGPEQARTAIRAASLRPSVKMCAGHSRTRMTIYICHICRD